MLSALALAGASGCSQGTNPEKAARHIAKDLRSGDPEVRQAAVEALQGMGRFSVKPVIEVLENGEPQEQYIAAQLLGKLNDPRAVEPLMKVAAGHPHEYVQAEAIQSLGKLGDPRALPVVERALDDSMDVVRERAMLAIGAFREPKVVPALLGALKDPSPEVRKNAMNALMRLRSTVASREKAIEDGKPDAEPLPPGVNMRGITDAIIQRTDDPDESVRYVAVQALGKLHDRATVPLLITKLDDPSTYVRQEAVLALSTIGDKRAVEPLVDLLSRSSREEEPVVRRALEKLTGQKFVLQD